MEGTEQILNKLDRGAAEEAAEQIALGPFNLPPPPPLSPEEVAECSKGAVTRVFGMLSTLDQSAASKSAVQSRGLNRLATTNHDRDGWVTLISRLATRASAGLEDTSIKSETHSLAKPSFSPSNAIRETLYIYIMEDFRRRIGVAIAWLNEEWYNDQILQRSTSSDTEFVPSHYERWMLKTLDGIMPFIESNDRNLLIRFLSEVPALDEAVLKRVIKLAQDPDRVSLVVMTLT